MWLKKNTRVRLVLADGTFEGTVRSAWWGRYRLTGAVHVTEVGEIPAAGEIRVPHRSVHYLQVLPAGEA